MSQSNVGNPSRPIWGILSVTLAALALLVFVGFTLFGGIVHPLWFFWFVLVVLLALLLFGLITGLTGVIQQELPRWLSITGVILTAVMIVAAILFLNWLIG